MILVIVRLRGRIEIAECETLEEAKEREKEWIAQEHRHYPNAKFIGEFYRVVEKLEVAD